MKHVMPAAPVGRSSRRRLSKGLGFCMALSLALDRLPHGVAAAYSMGRPIAKHKVDVYFSRITTSGRK